MVEPSNMSLLNAVPIFFTSYLFFKAVILHKNNNFIMEQERDQKILKNLIKSPRKGMAT